MSSRYFDLEAEAWAETMERGSRDSAFQGRTGKLLTTLPEPPIVHALDPWSARGALHAYRHGPE